MARIRRNSDLGTREGRAKLPQRSEPYFMAIHSGLSLGYRKTSRGGTWIMKRNIAMPADDEHEKSWRSRPELKLGIADDNPNADGIVVLDFAQAQHKAMEKATQATLRSGGKLYTVADAVSDYLEYQRGHRKSVAQTEGKLKAYVLPKLGDKLAAELTQSDFDAWLKWALQRRRKSSKKGAPSRDPGGTPAISLPNDPERQRKRKSTVNRVIAALKACLNHASKRHPGLSREVWAGLHKFRAVDSARQRWLSVKEATRLQNACSPQVRYLVRAALLTGARAGELLSVKAGDFDSRSKTLLIADSKSGKPRRIPLTVGGVELFEQLTAGKLDGDAVFTREDGSPWYRVAIGREIQQACEAAKIRPPATFHTLRHTYASHLVQESVPLLFVASALGHTDTRMVEKHYGHLAPSHVAEMIRQKLPSFGSMRRSNVRPIHKAKR